MNWQKKQPTDLKEYWLETSLKTKRNSFLKYP
jgi:hypothetical protein